MEPQWSNVYNRVNITLHNSEFGGVTMKEVEAGKYLNMVSTVNIRESAGDDDALTFDEVVQIGNIEAPSIINNQDEATSLFASDEEFSRRKTQQLLE